MKPIRVGIVGIGKIARDQNIPAIQGNSAFKLEAAGDIDLATDQGSINLSAGGGQLKVCADAVPPDPGTLASEYENIHGRFAGLIRQEKSEVAARPLQLVADIFLMATHVSVEAFVP